METEDDLGFILKAHLNIEFQLVQFISFHMKQRELCDWTYLTYMAKVNVALGLGLHRDLEKPLTYIGKIRNKFAHSLNYKFSDDEALKFFNSLEGTIIHRGVKHSCESALGRKLEPSKESFRDLFTLILINIRQAVKAAYLS